jgi:hypothetical protein
MASTIVETTTLTELAKIAHAIAPDRDEITVEDYLGCYQSAAEHLGITSDPEAEISEADADRLDEWVAEI